MKNNLFYCWKNHVYDAQTWRLTVKHVVYSDVYSV